MVLKIHVEGCECGGTLVHSLQEAWGYGRSLPSTLGGDDPPAHS